MATHWSISYYQSDGFAITLGSHWWGANWVGTSPEEYTHNQSVFDYWKGHCEPIEDEL